MKKEDYIAIRKRLAQIIEGTEWENHVFLVGGCVRDELMQRGLHDIDLAIDLPNGGIRFAWWLYSSRYTPKNRKPKIFEHFGTAKVRLRGFPHEEIDCVQTRGKRYEYEEIPHPEDNFGTILEDALCRDLTINSLYVNISTGELLDPTGQGLHDLENHIIRTPNDPDISLRDNAMHILRTIRFAVKFGWDLNESLIESMKKNLDIVAEATPRRMLNEVIAILRLKHRDRAMRYIDIVGARQYVAPVMTEVLERWNKNQERQRQKKQEEGQKDSEAESAGQAKPKRRKKRKYHHHRRHTQAHTENQ